MSSHDPLQPLVDAALEGDNRAVGELVRATQGAVRSVCRALGSFGETDDLVQETYARALASLDSFRGDAPFRSWLLTIARRTCADHVRRRQRERRLADRVRARTTTDHPPPRQHAEDLLHGLDPDRREAFILTQMCDLSYEEAAEIMGCAVGTIRSRVSRARADMLALQRDVAG